MRVDIEILWILPNWARVAKVAAALPHVLLQLRSASMVRRLTMIGKIVDFALNYHLQLLI